MWLLALLVFVLFLALYLATLSNNYSSDAMAFVTMATEGPAGSSIFVQAEHLFYPAVPWLWYKTWGLLGYSDGALRPLQALNSVAGATGVTLFSLSLSLMLRDKPARPLLSVLGALTLGASYSYWFHSTEAEDQIISISFVIASLLVVVMSKSRPNLRGGAALVVTASLAALFHATAVLTLPALLVGLQGWRRRIGFLVGVGLILLVSYLAVGAAALGFRSAADFWQWASSAPAKGVWGRVRPDNLAEAARTLGTSVLYSGNFPNLVGTPQDSPISPLVTVATIVGAITVVGYGVYRWRRTGWCFPVALAWLAAVTAFNLYWAPADIQFWIAAVAAIIMLSTMAWADLVESRRAWRSPLLGLAATAVAVVFAGNLFGAMSPRNDLSKNEGYATAVCLRDKTGASDLIVTPGWDWASSYLPYFAQREVVSLVDAYLMEARGSRERLDALLQKRQSEVRDRGGKFLAVRLFPMDETERAWFREAVGFDPASLGLEGKPIDECLGQPLWEIGP